MNEFKTGDRVLVSDNYHKEVPGTIIIEEPSTEGRLLVKLDVPTGFCYYDEKGSMGGGGTTCRYFNENEIKLMQVKVGDKLVLRKYGLCEDPMEIKDWAQIEGIPLNTPLTIKRVSCDGRWVGFEGRKYGHPVMKFERYNEKTNNMNKTIVGYKVKKVIPGDERPVGSEVKTSQNAYYDMLPDFWEPVYQVDDFKVGDWVVVLPTDPWYYNAEKDKAQKVLSVTPGSTLKYSLRFSNGATNSYDKLRYATASEIADAKKASVVKIAGYEANYENSGYVSFGCQSFSREEVNGILRLVSNGAVIKMDGKNIDIDLLSKIYNRIK